MRHGFDCWRSDQEVVCFRLVHPRPVVGTGRLSPVHDAWRVQPSGLPRTYGPADVYAALPCASGPDGGKRQSVRRLAEGQVAEGLPPDLDIAEPRLVAMVLKRDRAVFFRLL